MKVHLINCIQIKLHTAKIMFCEHVPFIQCQSCQQWCQLLFIQDSDCVPQSLPSLHLTFACVAYEFEKRSCNVLYINSMQNSKIALSMMIYADISQATYSLSGVMMYFKLWQHPCCRCAGCNVTSLTCSVNGRATL